VVIKIDRRPLAERLRDTLARSSLVIISGVAGVGKTAVVKDFYGQVRGSAPVFVFKATEFNLLTNANQLFRDYGDFTLSDLVQAFAETEDKHVVIDSAEELSSIEHPEVFEEVLATLRREGWRVIFTTRLSYLEDLERMLIQAYGVGFEPLNIEDLTGGELIHSSETYGFALPKKQSAKRAVAKSVLSERISSRQSEG
jgi:archaellum biogenesis ATPase FlaH